MTSRATVVPDDVSNGRTSASPELSGAGQASYKRVSLSAEVRSSAQGVPLTTGNASGGNLRQMTSDIINLFSSQPNTPSNNTASTPKSNRAIFGSAKNHGKYMMADTPIRPHKSNANILDNNLPTQDSMSPAEFILATEGMGPALMEEMNKQSMESITRKMPPLETRAPDHENHVNFQGVPSRDSSTLGSLRGKGALEQQQQRRVWNGTDESMASSSAFDSSFNSSSKMIVLNDNALRRRASSVGTRLSRGSVLLRGASSTIRRDGSRNGRFMPGVLNPRSRLVMKWDLYVGLLLVFTAVVTPFEVSFLDTRINVLFFMNRLVDVSFLMDIIVQFFMPYQTVEGDWIVDLQMICLKYLKGWFIVDIISVLPYDVVGIISGHEETGNIKLLRIIRLLRLVKLLRVLRAGRMFQRWESAVSIDYSILELAKFLVCILSLSHWLACGWHMAAVLGTEEWHVDADGNRAGGGSTWISNYEFTTPWSATFTLYITSYYWAAATLSTLGYGDVVPQSNLERIYATVCALFGATVYAYVIGAVCSIVAAMSEKDTAFYNQMDALNQFMAEKNLSPHLRVKLRDFFRFLRYNAPLLDRQDLLLRMSPKLRGDVTLQVNSKWIYKVPVFQNCSEEFVVALSMSLHPETYSQGEDIVRPGWQADKMFIVDKGIVGVRGWVVSGGGSFGEDMVYSRTTLSTAQAAIRNWSAKTLTNTAVQSLRQGALLKVLAKFPAERARVRRAVIKRIFRTAFMKYASAVRQIWQKYPDARLKDWHDEIEKCKGDAEVLPYLFDGKMGVMEVIREKSHLEVVLKAVARIAGNYRLHRFRKDIQNRREENRRFERGQVKLKFMLDRINMSMYDDIVVKHHLTFNLLAEVTAGDLAVAGIPLGHAVEILKAHKKLVAKEAAERAGGGVEEAHAAGGATDEEDFDEPEDGPMTPKKVGYRRGYGKAGMKRA